MASVLVLYVNDPIVGSCLALIRKVCEPRSSSKPHVTIRGPIRLLNRNRILPLYQNSSIPHIHFIGPGIFLSNKYNIDQQTVFLKCESKRLSVLSYKPDYPDSIFHVTLYNGPSRVFAKALLDVLNKYDWEITVPLPQGSKISEIILNTPNKLSNKNSNEPLYPTDLSLLFKKITNKEFTFQEMLELPDAERLVIIDNICAYLIQSARQLYKTNNDNQMPLYDIGNKTEVLNQRNHNLNSTKIENSTINKFGVILTPPELAIEIIDYIKSLLPLSFVINFGDPAIGTGTFFAALTRRYQQGSITSAIGIEIDSQRAIDTQNLWSSLGLHVFCDNFLKMQLKPSRSLIICNPPYVRHHHIPRSLKKKSLPSHNSFLKL